MCLVLVEGVFCCFCLCLCLICCSVVVAVVICLFGLAHFLMVLMGSDGLFPCRQLFLFSFLFFFSSSFYPQFSSKFLSPDFTNKHTLTIFQPFSFAFLTLPNCSRCPARRINTFVKYIRAFLCDWSRVNALSRSFIAPSRSPLSVCM